MWRKQTGTTLDFILLWDFLLSLISAKKYFAGNGKTYALGKELNKVPFFKKKNLYYRKWSPSQDLSKRICHRVLLKLVGEFTNYAITFSPILIPLLSL